MPNPLEQEPDFICASCGARNFQRSAGNKDGLKCTRCHSSAASFSMLRKIVPPSIQRGLLAPKSAKQVLGKVNCPACRTRMYLRDFAHPTGRVTVDICFACSLIWFDSGELTKLLRGKSDRPQNPKAPEVDDAKDMSVGVSVNNPEDWLLLFVPIPEVEVDEPDPKPPYATFGIVGLCAFLYLIPGAHSELGFRSTEPFYLFGLCIFSSLFVHGSLGHLFINGIYLILFGPAVETKIGRLRLFQLFVFGGLAGRFVAYWKFQSEPILLFGASGGLSGVLAFYFLQFPKARLTFRYLMHNGFELGVGKLTMSSKYCLIAFLLMQGLGAWAQTSLLPVLNREIANFPLNDPSFQYTFSALQSLGPTKFLTSAMASLFSDLQHVAYFSHFAGAIAGAVFYFLGGDEKELKKLPNRRKSPR